MNELVKKPFFCLVFVYLLLLACSANAAIYKYVDSEGHTIYSNIPKNGAKPANLPELSIYKNGNSTSPTRSPSPNKSNRAASAKRGAKAKSNHEVSGDLYANIDSQTQQGRDNLRKRILRQELDNERKALEDAQQTLADTRKENDANKIKKIQDVVTDRKKNIAALQQELNKR